MTTKAPRVILISSLSGPRSGKSTLARYFREEQGYVPISFASPIKRMVSTLLEEWYGGEPDEEAIVDRVYGSRKEEPLPGLGDGTVTTRRLLQTLGTEWREMIDRDLWVKIAIENAKAVLRCGEGVVIDDLRFAHEYQLFKQAFGDSLMHIAVTRPCQLHQQVSHASEDTSWITQENLDASLINNRSVDELTQQAQAAVNNWGQSEPSGNN